MPQPAAAPSLLSRPLLGGPFGVDGRYSLATVPRVERGLHSVQYLVVERAGTVLAVSEDKAGALAAARRLLAVAGELAPSLQAANDASQAELWAPEELPSIAPVASAERQVSRRRREIHEKSAGRCHYCNTALAIDGDWHIEHMLPRALGGGDDALNLVAACSECNLRKG